MPEALLAVSLIAASGFLLPALVRAAPPAFTYPVAFIGNLLGYGCTLLVVVFASRRRGLRQLSRDFGFVIKRADLGTGAAIAAGMLLFIGLVSAVLRHSGALAQPPSPVASPLIWIVLLQGLVGVAIAPIVEELTLRGLLMRAIRNAILRRRPAAERTAEIAINTSIIISAAAFAGLHLHEAHDLYSGVSVGVETFIFGLVAGWVATRTGRLGATVAAHILYNATIFAIMIAAS
ncbi:hypothetical protein B7R25_17495 [Subtercola boreus]|uniref:CAAX prenyl protease 2/Lysostaphin resistance protein A-like domain-containing protein n=2 Tax=Subtercola boreus TaxID=120213 RepID=A0A3E0W599_9MICO|nr:type II CAAX endopeptidase family protein [Subtercola boreus]RFA17833.1 hypothetical protein B7R24_16245 [Subtercola boreus]RFA17872.1 hypothetical protein B7R23_16300 [Subtercola boreus]RFA24143.1 hypothetical protein B7R25_17495 [Subtercola boreus]